MTHNIPRRWGHLGLNIIADTLAGAGLGDELIRKIFWKNAKKFIEDNIHNTKKLK